MAKLSFNDGDGVWRTVGGRRIFIRTGESLSSAMKKSGKFKSAKKKDYKVKEGNPIKDLADERIKEKENTLMNDKAMVSEMKRRGIDEVQGWKIEDFENRIKKNEEYLRVAKEQPAGAKFSKMLEENNVRTFADEIKENNNQITNALRRKAYQKYLKEHPASKITFENFKDMRKYQ